MKKLAYLMLSLLCVGFIASCSDDDEVENVPTPPAPQEEGILVLNSSKELMFDAAQGQQEVAFNANMGWTAEVAASNWLSVEPAKGEAGDIKMIVKVAANAETETRTGKIVLTTNDKKAKETIVVNQMQKDALVIAKAAYEIGYEGGEIVVKVGHNVEFDVKANVNWIKKQGSRAYTEEDLVFVVDANDGAAREGIITFSSKDGALKQEVKVSQEARPEDAALVVAEKQYTIAPEGGEITVKVNHNVEFDCTIDADWIVKDGTRAMQETSLTFVVAANETSEVREAKITFVAKNDASLKQIVTVRQNAGEGLVLGQTEYALSAEAQDIEIKVMHNVEFDHAIEGDWITLKETRSMQESTLVFSIAANEDTTDYNTREGKITFTSKDGKLSQEVKISQVAPGALVISQNEYTMAHDGGDLWLTINHNVEFTVAVDGEWIQQYDATRALEASTIGFKIVANESNDMRQGKITFTSKDGSLSQEVIVKQEGAPKVEVQPEPAGLVLEIDDNKFSQWVYDQGDYSYNFKGQRPSITFLYDESSDMNLLTIMEQVAPEYIGKVDFFKMDLTGDKNGATRRYVGVGELPNLYFASADIWPYPEMKDACNSATADTLRAWLKTAFNVEGDGGAATTEKIEVEFETIPQFPAEGGEKIVFINIVDLAQGHYFKYSLVGDDNNEHFELPAFEWLKYGVSGLLHLNAKPNTTAAEINSVSLRLTIEDAEFYGKVLVEKVMPLSIAAGQGGGETVDPLTLTLTAAYDKAADAVSLNAQCVSKDAASASIMLIDIPQLNEMIASSGMTIEEYFQIMNSIGGTLPLDDTQLANLNGEGFSIQLGAEVGLEAGVEYAFILGAYDAEYMMCKVARADVMFGEATTPEVTAPELEITSEFDAAENKLKFFVKSPSKNVESASYRCETKASIDELTGLGITLDQILDEMGEPLAGVDEVNGAGRMIVRSDKPAGEWYTCIVRATNAGGSTLKSLEAEFVGVEPFEATVTAAYEATENVINVNTVCTTKNAKLMGYFMVIPTQELDDTLVANGMTLEDYMMQYAMPYGKAEMIPDAVISTVNGEGFTMKAGADKNLIAGTNYACVVALYGPKAKMKAFRADTQFGEAPVAEETLYVKPETIAQFPAAGGVTRVKFGIKNHIQGHFLKFELIGNENGYFEDPIAQWPNYPTDCVFDLTANPNTTAEEINSVSLRIKIEDNEWYGNVVAEKVLPLSIAAGAPAPVEATVAVDPGVLEFAAEGGKQIVNLKKLYTGMGNMKYEIVGENSAMFSRADNWVNYGVENNLEVTAQPNTTGALVTANLEIWVEDFSKKVIGEKVIVPLSIAAGESKPEVDPANCYKLLTDKSQLKAGAEVLFLSPDDAWILTGDDATDGSYFCKVGSSMFTLDAAAQMITDPGQGQIFIVEESTAAAGAFRFVVKGLDSYLESYGTGKYDDLGFGGGTKDDRCVWNVNAGENNTWNVANLPEFSGKHCLTYDKSYPAFSGGNPGEVNYVRIYVK